MAPSSWACPCVFHRDRGLRRLGFHGTALAILLLAFLSAPAADAPLPRWWSIPGQEPLAVLGPDSVLFSPDDDGTSSSTLLVEPWRIPRGTVIAEHAMDAGTGAAPSIPTADLDPGLSSPGAGPSGPGGSLILKARDDVRLCAGDASWKDYVVTAEVQLGSTQPLRLSVANTETADAIAPGHCLDIQASGEDTAVWAQARLDAARNATPAPRLLYRLRPDLRWLATVRYTFIETPMSEESIQSRIDSFKLEESRPDQYWNTKWLRLRIEVTSRAVRMWLDGVLIAWTPTPAQASGPLCLELHKNDRVRLLTVQRLPPELEGFVPLDLKARHNSIGLGPKGDLGDRSSFATGALPPAEQHILVDGVPFLWNSGGEGPDHLDTSALTVQDGPRYIHGNALGGEYKRRVLLRVPSRQYNELAVIAAADTSPRNTGQIEARMFASSRVMWVGSDAPVPAWNATQAVHAVPLPVGPMVGRPSEAGRLWLVRIPLDPGMFQHFIDGDAAGTGTLEFDLCGTPGRSGVHLFAATLIESPVQMHVRSREIGHLFVQPQVPTFEFALRNMTRTPRQGSLQVAVGDFYGKTNRHEFAYSLAPGQAATLTNALPCEKLGHHDFDARLLDAEGAPLIRRQTTFALLPPDTRQAERDSPFGMWTFNSGHYGAGPEASGAVMSKAGARYGHHVDLARKVYGSWYSFRGLEEEEPELAGLRAQAHLDHWTVFAEATLGSDGGDYGRFLSELLETPKPLPLNAAAEARLRSCWNSAVRYSETVRKHYPDKKLVFGNGYPQFIVSFLERGYPRRYLDGMALDFIGDNMNMFFYLGEAAKHYGYGGIPFFVSEGFYIGSGRGFLPDRGSELRQSDAYIRGFLRGLALGIERFLGSSEVWDNGGDYYLSGYGPVGLCHRAPETNPKPSYPAYATMTLLLDRARFDSLVPTGSLNVHLLRFDGREGPVYAAWTARGRRSLRFAAEGASPCLTDSQCNDVPLALRDGRVTFDLDETPVWIRHAGRVSDVHVGPATYDEAPAGSARKLGSPGAGGDWALSTNACDAMEARDVSQPVCIGRFTLGSDSGRAPGESALAVTLGEQPGVSVHRLRYAALRPPKALPIPAEAAALGVWVYGNGAATLHVEVRDSEGETWHSIPGPSTYSFGMPYAGAWAFDGWRYLRFALPPRSHAGKGNGKPDKPFTLAGLWIEQYAKVLYVNRLEAPSTPTWRIGDILWE